PFSSANETSSAGVLDLRSWSLISRMGVVLWRSFEEGVQAGFGKSGREKEVRKLKARKAPDEGFKPDAAAGSNRNATTSACVGWDELNIEKRAAFRKQRKSHTHHQVRS